MDTRGRKRKISVSIFAVFTVVLMAAFFNLYDPWQPVGPELIPDGSFSSPSATNSWSGWGEWTRLVPDGGYAGSPGVVLTCSSNAHGTLRFTIYNLTNIPAFRVSLRAAAKDVIPGTKGYHVPRAIFFYHDQTGKSLYGLHHGVTDISEDTEWKQYEDVFPVPEGASNGRFHIQNLAVGGIMHVDDLSVVPVRERPSAPWWKLFFGTLWMTSFGLCLFVLRPWAHRLGPLIMLTLAIIMTGIVLPGEFLDSSIEKSLDTVKHLIPKPAAPVTAVQPEQSAVQAPAKMPPVKPKAGPVVTAVEKEVDHVHILGHFGLFSLLAFLCALSWISAPLSKRRVFSVLACLTFFAAATEVLQFIPPERSAGLGDLLVDTSGMAGAVVFICLIRLRHNRLG